MPNNLAIRLCSAFFFHPRLHMHRYRFPHAARQPFGIVFDVSADAQRLICLVSFHAFLQKLPPGSARTDALGQMCLAISRLPGGARNPCPASCGRVGRMTKPPAGAEGWLSLSAETRSQTIPLVGAAGAARGSRSRAHLPGGAHPPADRRRWLCDIVSGLYATTQWGCAAGMWLELGGIKHGHAHTGYMIAAGCCAGLAAAKEETWKAVCLTIPWYQFTPSKVTWRDILKPLSLFGAAVLRGAPKYRVGWRS